MSEKLSIYKMVRMLSRRRAGFVLCVLITVLKALFYGGFFTYEVKSILQGIELQDKMLVSKCMFQLFIAVIVTALLNLLYVRLKTDSVNKMIADMEDVLIEKMSQYFNAFENKTKLTVLQNTVTNLINTAVEYIYGIIYLVTILCVSITYGMLINKWVTASGIVISGILVMFTFRFGKDISEKFKESEAATNDVYGKLWEINDNLEILPFLNKDKTYEHLDDAIVNENRLKIESSRLMNLSRIFMRFSHVGAVLFAGLLGGFFVYWGKLTPADLMGIILLLPMVSDSLFQIPAKVNEYHSINGMCNVIHNFITPNDFPIISKGKSAEMNGAIRIKVDHLNYTINEQKEIRIPNIEFESGKIYGLYGESGTGKTTFLKILTKLIPEYSGSISVNDINLSQLNHRDWWKQITYLEQQSVIIPGTVNDNIVLDKEVNEDLKDQAIHFARLDDFIRNRKNADSEISLDSISSGEKQQICLARMFYQSRPIIIMDEATSALSPKNEKMVLENIIHWVKKEKKILLMVSHNDDVISCCDEKISF